MSQSTQTTTPTRDEIIAKLIAVNEGSDLAGTLSQEQVASVTIAAGSGIFNCHGVLAVWLLKQLPEYKQASLVRTRNPAVFSQSHVCVDVGATYDYKQLRFDFRGRDFSATFNDSVNVKMTTAGLIYKHFGARVLQALTANSKLSTAEYSLVFDHIYKDFVLPIDAAGQLIKPYSDAVMEPLFVDRTTLTHQVSRLNPSCFEAATEAAYNAGFDKALALVGEHFQQAVDDAINIWLRSMSCVEKALVKRQQTHVSGQIIMLDSYCDYASHIYALEKQMEISPIGCVIYLKNDGSGEWMVTCVAVCKGDRKARCSMPQAYAGLKPEELKAASGIADISFVHPNRVMGGAKSYEGAMKLAVTAIANI